MAQERLLKLRRRETAREEETEASAKERERELPSAAAADQKAYSSTCTPAIRGILTF